LPALLAVSTFRLCNALRRAEEVEEIRQAAEDESRRAEAVRSGTV